MPNFEIRHEGGCATVVPAGDVVASSVAELRGPIRELVRSGVHDIVFDLSRAEMLDSTGLGLLLSAYNSLSAAGGSFSVTGASPELLELLHGMRLHQHFSVSGR